ncbi:MAG: hypothetical protein H7255_09830, partial [Ramlibacter sp.]|nr:hypothetical protein [Ramlibacter sp.]
MNRSSLSDPRSSLSYGHFPSQAEAREDASAPPQVGSKRMHLDQPRGKRAEVAKRPEIRPQAKFPLPMRENTPAPVAKPETKFQKGLAESEVVMGDLFQALSHTADHPVDGYEVSRLCGALTKTLEKNVEGHMHETVTGKYALRAVEGMTKDELLSVQRGFETLNLRDENVANIMRYVTGQLRALNVDPELAGLVKEIAVVGKYDDPVKIWPIYNQMMLTAGQLLAGKGKQSTPDLQRAFVMNAIDKMLQSGELSVTAAKGFISQLPTEEQRAIVTDGATPQEERLVKRMAPAVACSIAGICLWAKTDVLAKSPAHFAKAVIDTEEYLRKDGGRRQRPEVYEAQRELIRSEVGSLLAQNSLPVEALADEQLRELDGALGRLGITHGRSEIMTEILRRDGRAPLPANGSKHIAKAGLAGRVMNAMTHSSMRTDAKVRMGRQE